MSKLKKGVSHEQDLTERLKDPTYAVVMLNSALAKNDKRAKDRLLSVLRLVAKAYGVSNVARETTMQRETIRKALSEKGNPTLSTVLTLLKAFGITLKFDTEKTATEHTQQNAEINRVSKLEEQVSNLEKKFEERRTVIVRFEKGTESNTNIGEVSLTASSSSDTSQEGDNVH